MYRRHKAFYFVLMAMIIFFSCGCAGLGDLSLHSKSLEETEPVEQHTRLVGDMAVPFGLYPVRVEAVGLITGLHGTGSDPPPSPQRSFLIEEMQTRGVTNPNSVLASGNTSLVLMQGFLRPGIQKGDRFDVELRVPGQSETTSLRGGYLLETQLREMAVLENRVREGNVLALVQGPVLVDPLADAKSDKVAACRGRILGGGAALKSRSLGLVLKPDYQSVANSSRVANAVNHRFHTFQNGIKVGMAKAKTDEYIELTVHPRYKDNIARYVEVVRALAITESASERMERMQELERQLMEPAASARAALQLEALGQDGAKTLLKALESKEAEVRFYAAEALAYLDRREAAEPLGQIAAQQPAFRVFALSALSSMQDFAAYEQLRELLSSPSVETRYGAFRALWTMNKKEPLVAGENLGGQFQYHVLDVADPSLIHVTYNRLPEIVLFGKEQKLLPPLKIDAGNQIMVNSTNSGEIAVSKFAVKEGDQKRTVSTNVDEVIRAVVELGGTYPDVVQMLQEAKAAGALASRFEVDAVPEAARSYERLAGEEDDSSETNSTEKTEKAGPKSPTPDLFHKKLDQISSEKGDDSPKTSADGSSEEKNSDEKPSKKGFWGKMYGFGYAEKGQSHFC